MTRNYNRFIAVTITAFLLFGVIVGCTSQFEIDKQELCTFDNSDISIGNEYELILFIITAKKEYDQKSKSISDGYIGVDSKIKSQRDTLKQLLESNYKEHLRRAVEATTIHFTVIEPTAIRFSLDEEDIVDSIILFDNRIQQVHDLVEKGKHEEAFTYMFNHFSSGPRETFTACLLYEVFGTQFAEGALLRLKTIENRCASNRISEDDFKESKQLISYFAAFNTDDYREQISLASSLGRMSVKYICSDIAGCSREGTHPITFKDTGETNYYCKPHHDDYIEILRSLGKDY